MQLQWYFIKNTDEGDTDIITDAATDDSISVEGLTMTVTLDPENIHRFGHAHCFVADVDEENGHAVSELKRALDVVNVRGKNVIEPDATESNYRVFLNLEDATAEEIASLQVKIIETDTNDGKAEKSGTVESDLTVKHVLGAEHKVREIDITVYPEGKEQNYAKAITYCRPLGPKEMTNARGNDNDEEYISEIKNDIYDFHVDSSYPDGTPAKVTLQLIDANEKVLGETLRDTTVSGKQVSFLFEIPEIAKEKNIKLSDIYECKGVVEWED